MSTTKSTLSFWFDRCVSEGATHMIVACDTFDWEDYPVYVQPGQNVREVADEFRGKNMQTLMEVYDLRMDKEYQLSEFRAFHW